MISQMPKRNPETPTPFEAAELRLLRAKLVAWAAKIESAVQYVEDSRAPLYVFKAASLREGITRAAPFFDALEDSVIAAASGDPINAETRKTRVATRKVAETKGRTKKGK